MNIDERTVIKSCGVRRCLLLVLIAASGCSLARSPGISGNGARRFYLTQATVDGSKALTACARGFHMASRFELTDPALLAYDTVLGVTTDDSGSGPPSAAAVYGSPGPSGWVRTGGGSQYTDAAGAPGSAFTNCSTWSTSTHETFGTVAFLTDRFGAALWDGGSRRCDEKFHVWCVEDRIAPPEREPGERPHGHRGHFGE